MRAGSLALKIAVTLLKGANSHSHPLHTDEPSLTNDYLKNQIVFSERLLIFPLIGRVTSTTSFGSFFL